MKIHDPKQKGKKKVYQNNTVKPGMAPQVCNPKAQEVENGGLLQVWGPPG